MALDLLQWVIVGDAVARDVWEEGMVGIPLPLYCVWEEIRTRNVESW